MGKLKITTVRVDEEDLKLAKALGINLSRLLRESIRRLASGGEEMLKAWLEEERKRLQEEFMRRREGEVCPHCGSKLKGELLVDERDKPVEKRLVCPNLSCPWLIEHHSPWSKTVTRYTSEASSEWDLL